MYNILCGREQKKRKNRKIGDANGRETYMKKARTYSELNTLRARLTLLNVPPGIRKSLNSKIFSCCINFFFIHFPRFSKEKRSLWHFMFFGFTLYFLAFIWPSSFLCSIHQSVKASIRYRDAFHSFGERVYISNKRKKKKIHSAIDYTTLCILNY